MIDQLISIVTQKLGIDAGTAEKAVGIVMGLLQKEGDSSAITALFDQIPGAGDLAEKFGESQSSGGGLMGAVGGMLGGNAGDLLGSLGALKDTGLSTDQLGDMVPAMKDFFVEKAGPETVEQALNSVPALKKLLG